MNVIHIAIGELGIAAIVPIIVPFMIGYNIILSFIFQEHFHHFALVFRRYLPPGHLIMNTIKTFRDSADLSIMAMNYSKHMAAILKAYIDLVLHY